MRIIQRVEKGSFLDQELDSYFSRSITDQSKKSLIYDIAAGVVRWRLYLEWLISLYVKKRTKKQLEILLKIALYQLEFMRKPFYHVINETVSFAKSKWGDEIGNFVNAVLRNHMRTKDSLNPPNLSIKYSFPGWLVARWEKRFKEETATLLFCLNRPLRFGLRINTKLISQKEAIDLLNRKGISVEKGKYLNYALYTKKLMPLLQDDLFKEGFIYVQDEASQLSVEAMNLAGGELVLDACCGYGTKTRQILDLWGSRCKVVCIDKSRNKVKKVSDRALRVVGDILALPFKQNLFDSILLDAPCSSLGIIHKHPEIKWRVEEEDIQRLAEIQLSLLEALWETLKPGGSLVYSVCSFEPEETFWVIEKFQKKLNAKLVRALPFTEEPYFISIPHKSGMDGFFIAKFKKICA
ncbi:MAG: methyltransferase domain-containing protein [Desulfobacterota bacterium]|nr:methyltransferase domain-containing protein [Thermodesulfobacteriota bacterium]